MPALQVRQALTGVTSGIQAGYGGASSAASARLNGLSAPQILAVAVGSVAFLALAILCLWCLCRRRARTREARKANEREMDARALLARNGAGATSEVELKQPTTIKTSGSPPRSAQPQQAGMKQSQSQQSWKSFEAGQLTPPRPGRAEGSSGSGYAQHPPSAYAHEPMPMPSYAAPPQQMPSYAAQPQQMPSYGAPPQPAQQHYAPQQRWSGGAGYAL